MEGLDQIGFVFSPKEHEIFDYFLRMKINGKELPEDYQNVLKECDLYGGEHPRNMFNPNGENNYMFTRLSLRSSKRINRQLKKKDWTWKLDKSEDIVVNGRLLGKKRSLTFMEGAKTGSSHWNMDEYTFPDWKNKDWAFCCVRYNGGTPVVDDGKEMMEKLNKVPAKKRRIGDENIGNSVLEAEQVPRNMHTFASSSSSVPNNMHYFPSSSSSVPRNTFHDVPQTVYDTRNMFQTVPAQSYTPQPQEHRLPQQQAAQPTIAITMENLPHGTAYLHQPVWNQPHSVQVQLDQHKEAMEGLSENCNVDICGMTQQLAPKVPVPDVRIVETDLEKFQRALKTWVPSERLLQAFDVVVNNSKSDDFPFNPPQQSQANELDDDVHAPEVAPAQEAAHYMPQEAQQESNTTAATVTDEVLTDSGNYTSSSEQRRQLEEEAYLTGNYDIGSLLEDDLWNIVDMLDE